MALNVVKYSSLHIHIQLSLIVACFLVQPMFFPVEETIPPCTFVNVSDINSTSHIVLLFVTAGLGDRNVDVREGIVRMVIVY